MTEITVKFKENIATFLSDNQMTIIAFFVVLIVGYIAVKIIGSITAKALRKSRINDTMTGFLTGLLKSFLTVAYVIVLLTIAGVPMTTFIAMLSAAGLAVALALQGNLSNFASGLMIVFFKPFIVGDYIESQGVSGTVKEIQILYTHLLTPDNRKVIIPNTDLTQSRVVNFTSEPTRRLDLVFSVDYNSNIEQVKNLISEVIRHQENIMKVPEPLVRLGRQGESALDFDVKVWVKKDDYWNVHYGLHETIKNEFDKNGIEIPFPHRSIIIKQEHGAGTAIERGN